MAHVRRRGKRKDGTWRWEARIPDPARPGVTTGRAAAPDGTRVRPLLQARRGWLDGQAREGTSRGAAGAAGGAPVPRPPAHLRRPLYRGGRAPEADLSAARAVLDHRHARPLRPPIPVDEEARCTCGYREARSANPSRRALSMSRLSTGCFRLRAATSKTGRALWVDLPDVLGEAIEQALPPREDRDRAARLFASSGAGAIRTSIAKACRRRHPAVVAARSPPPADQPPPPAGADVDGDRRARGTAFTEGDERHLHARARRRPRARLRGAAISALTVRGQATPRYLRSALRITDEVVSVIARPFGQRVTKLRVQPDRLDARNARAHRRTPDFPTTEHLVDVVAGLGFLREPCD